MQGVCLVRHGGVEPGARQLLAHLRLGVDPYVAADRLGGVVLVADLPADLLGEGRRDCGRDRSARLQNPEELVIGRDVIGDVLEDLARDDLVERVVGERQAGAISLDLGMHQLAIEEAVVDEQGRGVADCFKLGHRHVAAHDMGTFHQRFVGVAAEAAAEIKEHVAGAHIELCVVDRQHQCSSLGMRPKVSEPVRDPLIG